MNGVRAAMQGDKFAVVKMYHIHHRVTEGDRVQIGYPIWADIGEKIRFKQVSMLGGEQFTAIGRPLLKGASVEATVEEHFKSKLQYNYLRYSGEQGAGRWVDHSSPQTIVRIDKIVFEPEMKVEGSETPYTIADQGDADEAALKDLEAQEDAINPVRWSSNPNGPLYDAHYRPSVDPEVGQFIKWRKLEQIQQNKLYSPGMRYWYWPKDRFTSGTLNASR
eukprot:TRINITY_DN22871_c0_g1_i1.p1 TRINITY_DN22871_c0_g1~~TRINITY_DN22871_c0_g1_i1.p1  ORF type:complete len:240 (+),score=111.07 TRINITY_DN22871_c0_g1_i1:63-722(+)